MRIIFVVVLVISITAPAFPRMTDSSSIQESTYQDTVRQENPLQRLWRVKSLREIQEANTRARNFGARLHLLPRCAMQGSVCSPEAGWVLLSAQP